MWYFRAFSCFVAAFAVEFAGRALAVTDDFGDKDHDRLAAEALISRVSRRFFLGSRSAHAQRSRGQKFASNQNKPHAVRLAPREAVRGTDKLSWDDGGGVDV